MSQSTCIDESTGQSRTRQGIRVEESAVSAVEQPEAAPPASEPRWPGIAALALMVVRPATTARRTQHVSLPGAYGVHLLAAVFTLVVICAATALADAPSPLTRTAVVKGINDILVDVVVEVGRFPGWALLAFLGTILLPEVIIAALALTIMPWGARDEPLRTSYRHSLRTLLLCTAAIPVLAVVISATVVPLERFSWQSVFEANAAAPTPTNAAPGSPEWNQWQQASSKYWETYWTERQAWIVKQPWYVRYPQIVVINVVFACIAWFLFLTLRAVGAARSTIPIARPPHCEACGYNLSTIPMESRCPECGEPVAASLGPKARRGVPWQQWRAIGRWLAWWQTTGEAIHRSKTFGRLPQLTSGTTDHRTFIAWHLPMVFAIGAATIPVVYFAIEGGIMFIDVPEAAFTVTTVVGSLCVFGATGMTLLSATSVGLFMSHSQKRNLLPGAIQVSSYLMTYLTAWCLFGVSLGIAVAAGGNEGWFLKVEDRIGVDDDILATLTWIIPNAVIGIYYFVLVARGVAGTRYANR